VRAVVGRCLSERTRLAQNVPDQVTHTPTFIAQGEADSALAAADRSRPKRAPPKPVAGLAESLGGLVRQEKVAVETEEVVGAELG